ncbi:MAG: ATP synthase F1 subunit delta [Oscillospiraceae bacterium]|nr:ATP synthase F1 subunit delta [Oscillospiraceae bacterium]
MASVEKTYADAFFSLLESENPDIVSGRAAFDTAMTQLKCVGESFDQTPDLLKLMNTPTISDAEKLGILDAAVGGKVTDYVHNFLRVLAVKRRMSYYSRIVKAFSEQYNQRFDIAEITVTSAMPIDAATQSRIGAKMANITGKPVENIVITTKVDKSLIGGVMVDHGNTRLDGSVKTRLAELGKDIAGTIA